MEKINFWWNRCYALLLPYHYVDEKFVDTKNIDEQYTNKIQWKK